MSENRVSRGLSSVVAVSLALLALGPWLLPGCAGGVTPRTPDVDGDGDSDVVATNYKGTISGLVSESRSTRESIDAVDAAASQVLPTDLDPSEVDVTFEDLEGQTLLDADGEPYPPVPVDETGTFEAENLPVGIDIVVTVDLDGDGEPDIEQIVQIPADETGEAGDITDVMIDPLTTLIVEKLKELLEEQGINANELDVSPTAVVHRLVDAFIHLFEESGVDRSVTLEDIRGLKTQKAADLFDAIIPAVVRTGMNTLEGNLALARASEIEDMIRATAEVFLRSGFPVADDPGGIDLSFLGDLPDVEIMSIRDLRPPDDQLVEVAQFESIGLESEEFDDLLGDGTLDELLGDGTIEDLINDGILDEYLVDGEFDEEFLDQFDGEYPGDFPDTLPETIFPFDPESGGEEPIVYINTVMEPDRNFIANDEFAPKDGGPPLPILNERLIQRVAALYLERRVITVRNLYRLITDAEIGLGARVTYMLPMPGFAGPPPMVFETADGEGIARDTDQLMFDLVDLGLADPGAGFDRLHSERERIRTMMRDLLAGTVPPSIERMFGPILGERIEGVEQLAQFIRRVRAHLPFNRSGPSMFYVVADGDPWRPDAPEVYPVSVNIEFDADGSPARVTYDPSHAGRYYLAFTHETESNHLVELLVRETGRWLHGPHGEPMLLNMADEQLFEPINGEPFVAFVSEAGTFWPGVPVAVSNPDHYMDAEIRTASMDGPTMQLFVLATEPGPDAEPVRVDYDVGTGMFSYDPNGRYYMMFLPETEEEGVFGLYDIDMNFMASVNDLTQDFFVEAPPPMGPAPYPGEPYPPEDEPPPPPDGEFPPPPDDGTVVEDAPVDEPPADLQPAATVDDSPVEDDPDVPAPVDEPPADTQEPVTEDQPIIVDDQPPPDGEFPPPEDGLLPPPDGEFQSPVFEPARVRPEEVIGLYVQPEFYTFVYGTDVSNENFNPDGNPYFDDVNGNGIEDPGEFTADSRPMLFNPDDWRSTDVSRYYRTESGQAVVIQDVDFEAPEPRTFSGEALVPRDFLPRLNAFKYGRPNSAINLLTAFLPPEFFDGTHVLDENTRLGVLQAIAMINLVMEQVFNSEALIDIDGPGPFEPQRMLIDAHLFVTPIGDPFVLILDGFEQLSESAEDSE